MNFNHYSNSLSNKKLNKLEFINKNLYFKEQIKKVKKAKTTVQEKTFAHPISVKELISRMSKECLELNNKRTNNPIKKWANYSKTFLVRYTNGQEEMKRCLISLAIREIQFKDHKFTACRIVKRKQSDNSKC